MQAIDEAHELRPGPARPGPVGLLIRVVLGMAAIYGLVDLATSWDVFRDQDLIESDFWFITLFTLCLLPDVFNIGLRRRWGLWPLVVFVALSVSFPVAIVTRTPGCELNAVPRLVARLRGTADAETRRCILGVDLLDGQPMRRPRRS